MKKKTWYGIEKKTNPYGFGCWQIAGEHYHQKIPHGWGSITNLEATDILCKAIENDIDFFDTAQGYNDGKSERLLGKAIEVTKKPVVVCTKIALTNEEIINGKISSEFKKRVEKSLNNLKLPIIDILLIHNPPDNIIWKDFNYEILENLVQEKIIGTYGVSSKGLEGAKNVIESEVGTVLEWVFNIFERRPIKELFPAMKQKKINFIARSTLSRGLINPKYIKKNPFFNNDDFRSTLSKDWIDWTINSLREFYRNGVKESKILSSALEFCLHHEQVNSVVLGIKSKKQLEDYLNISNANKKYFDFKLLNNLPEFYPKWG